MARLIVIFLALFLFVPQTGCYPQNKEGQVKSQGRLEKENSASWDFGDINEREIAKHEFVVTNNTGKTLNILDVNSSCGCTVSEIKKRVLAPGESSSLEVKFNSKGYNGWAQQYVYVHTDNPENPILRFIIRANVIPKTVQK